jgi:hypothetical protein
LLICHRLKMAAIQITHAVNIGFFVQIQPGTMTSRYAE